MAGLTLAPRYVVLSLAVPGDGDPLAARRRLDRMARALAPEDLALLDGTAAPSSPPGAVAGRTTWSPGWRRPAGCRSPRP